VSTHGYICVYMPARDHWPCRILNETLKYRSVTSVHDDPLLPNSQLLITVADL